MSTLAGYTITNVGESVTEECCDCGITFAMPAQFRQQLLNDRGRSFWCPNGHGQHYTGPTDAQRLKWAQQREQATRDQLQASERSKAALKGVITKTKRRVGNGLNIALHIIEREAHS